MHSPLEALEVLVQQVVCLWRIGDDGHVSLAALGALLHQVHGMP